MIYTEKIIKAMKLMEFTHSDKVDKIGVPYVFHPYNVAERIIHEESEYGGIKDCKALEKCIIIALLHDVIEADIEDIEERVKRFGYTEKVRVVLVEDRYKEIVNKITTEFGKEIADAVIVLTRKKEDTYTEYIEKVCANPYAVKVKIQDIKDNMNPNRVSMMDNSEERDSLSKRYIKALETLVKYERL